MEDGGKAWNVSLIEHLFPLAISDAIKKIQIPGLPKPNSLIWFPSKTGDFSIKSSYRVNQKKRFSTQTTASKQLWRQI